MNKLAVVALGGNALLRGDQLGTIDEQEQNTTETLENLVFLIREGYDLVITHGNGPQIGNILLQNDAGEIMYKLPQMPVDMCVADTQGSIGYMIERMLRNVLNKHRIQKEIVTLVTLVMVDKEDPAFKEPVKGIGKLYTSEESKELFRDKGWVFKPDSKSEDAWRRVVPSPMPVKVMNHNVVQALARQGTIVIAAGGGGVPVYIDKKNNVRPAEVVIDKDLASSILASEISANEFYILTDVPYVYINYKKPGEKPVEFLNRDDTISYLKQGMFGEGSMSPKIKACLTFIENGGEKSIITEAFKLKDKKFGTKITMEYEN